jgi:type II secretory pathway component PulM
MVLLLMPVLIILLAKAWFVYLGAYLLYLGWVEVVGPWEARWPNERAQWARYRQAAREIEAVTVTAARAMHEAAGPEESHHTVTEASASETTASVRPAR